MEEDLGVKKVIMVEKQEDRFDLWSLFIKNNYLKVFIWRNLFLDFWIRLDYWCVSNATIKLFLLFKR